MIDKDWTLFLDRDGVLNQDHVGGYVLSVDEFKLYDGVKEAMQQFAQQFGRIVICTNQRCIGRGLLTDQGLREIHDYLLQLIVPSGGRIDHFYYASSLSDLDPLRKPNPGMAIQAMADFPEIDLEKSIMVGNNPTDMGFAKNAGIKYPVFLTTTIDDLSFMGSDHYPHYDSLAAFAAAIKAGVTPDLV